MWDWISPSSMGIAGDAMLVDFITPPCLNCGKQSTVKVDAEALYRWRTRGLLIQDAFPRLTDEEREVLLTGTHPECWNTMLSHVYEPYEEDGEIMCGICGEQEDHETHIPCDDCGRKGEHDLSVEH